MLQSNSALVILIALVSVIAIGFLINNCINEQYLQTDPMLITLKETIKDIHPEAENIKLYQGTKSYTLNKDKIFICLKDENDEYYPINMLIYVLLHELSHKINKDDIGHTEKFHIIFQDLIEKAHNMGIYNPNIPPVKNYCTDTQE
jgi:hypothetical protein